MSESAIRARTETNNLLTSSTDYNGISGTVWSLNLQLKKDAEFH